VQPPVSPKNEATRINALHSLVILDTDAEERFDRLTRMAKRMFDVPIALVSLVDVNRQWFKSKQGLDARETSRDISFCGHAILGESTFIIEDTKKDERFADNPLVTGAPFIRFYAGRPIKLNGNLKLGTLCLIDVVPRKLNSSDLQLLSDLAEMVESELSAMQSATIDELTQISNRRGFNALANKSLEYCKRNNVSASLAYIDLNNFKQINDSFGHAAGDQALRDFSRLILENFRESDIAARLGGDEFAALLLNTNQDAAELAIQKFSQSLSIFNASKRDSNKDYDLSFSYGLTQIDPNRHPNIEDALNEADTKMYQTKQLSEQTTNL